MSYKTYTTRAFVVNAYDRVGADRTVLLFTEDAGMLKARAIGVREEKSKMRYALQPFSFVRVSLVRGKNEWRLIGAEPEENLFFTAASRESRGALLRVTKLLIRLIHGEEAHQNLFQTFKEGLVHLAHDPRLVCERALVLKLLFMLGYIADERLGAISKAGTLGVAAELLGEIPLGLSIASSRIDEALAVSHL